MTLSQHHLSVVSCLSDSFHRPRFFATYLKIRTSRPGTVGFLILERKKVATIFQVYSLKWPIFSQLFIYRQIGISQQPKLYVPWRLAQVFKRILCNRYSLRFFAWWKAYSLILRSQSSRYSVHWQRLWSWKLTKWTAWGRTWHLLDALSKKNWYTTKGIVQCVCFGKAHACPAPYSFCRVQWWSNCTSLLAAFTRTGRDSTCIWILWIRFWTFFYHDLSR